MYETHDKRALLLPKVTSADAGKVLAVDENGKLSLEEMGSGLPEVDSSDAGRVLTVSEDGEWEAAAPSGGGITLYGPYYATVDDSATIPADGTAHPINLTVIYDTDFLTQVELPSLPVKYTLYGFSIGSPDLVNVGVYPPGYFEGELQQPYMAFFNRTESAIMVQSQTVFVSFYSDTQLQPLDV